MRVYVCVRMCVCVHTFHLYNKSSRHAASENNYSHTRAAEKMSALHKLLKTSRFDRRGRREGGACDCWQRQVYTGVLTSENTVSDCCLAAL